jgi:uncharacterized protein YodC (DUF2158 family)
MITCYTDFSIGDRVVLKNGSSARIVTDKSNGKLRTEYVLGGRTAAQWNSGTDWRSWRDFNLIESANNTPKGKKMTDKSNQGKLFQTVAEPHLRGIWLAVNADGKIVLNMEGDNTKYQEYAADEIEKVLPYTVAVMFYSVSSAKDKATHFMVKPGDLVVGDVVIQDDSFRLGVVTKIDTKSEDTVKEFKGRKVNISDI